MPCQFSKSGSITSCLDIVSGFQKGGSAIHRSLPSKPVSGHKSSLWWICLLQNYPFLLESFPPHVPCPLQPPVIMTKLFTWPPQTLLRPLGHSQALISSKVQLCWAVNSAGWIQGMRLGMGVWHLPRSIFGYSPFCWLCENSVVILHVDGDPQCLKWIRVMCLVFVGL